jgi:hypothetical protein
VLSRNGADTLSARPERCLNGFLNCGFNPRPAQGLSFGFSLGERCGDVAAMLSPTTSEVSQQLRGRDMEIAIDASRCLSLLAVPTSDLRKCWSHGTEAQNDH